MPELIFEGDWSPADAEAIATTLRKSLGMGDGESVPDDLAPFSISGDWQKMLSDRQKKLLDAWKKAGRKGLPSLADLEEMEKASEEDRDWERYSLKKSLFSGALKRQADGDVLRLNNNSRWEMYQDASDRPTPHRATRPDEFLFPERDGEYGEGVYLPVDPGANGYIRIRCRIDVMPKQAITQTEFYQLEDSLAANVSMLLDARDVRAILTTEGDRVT